MLCFDGDRHLRDDGDLIRDLHIEQQSVCRRVPGKRVSQHRSQPLLVYCCPTTAVLLLCHSLDWLPTVFLSADIKPKTTATLYFL